MDQKPDSRKRSFSQLDESSLICPNCKDLDEHINKNCPNQLSQSAHNPHQGSSSSMEMDSDKDKTYGCDKCFTDSQCLDEHQQKNCLNMAGITRSVIEDSYKKCMEDLVQAIFDEKDNFDSLRAERSKVQDSIKRYTDLSLLKAAAYKDYRKAVACKQISGTVVSPKEQKILSRHVSETLQKHEDLTDALEREWKPLSYAVSDAKLYNSLARLCAVNVHIAFSEAMSVLSELLLPTISGYRSPKAEQELKKIEDILKDRRSLLSQLQDGLADLEATIEPMMKIGLKEEKSTTSGNEKGGQNATQENLTVNGAQVSRTEADRGIQGDAGPSSSATCSGSSDACQSPGNMK